MSVARANWVALALVVSVGVGACGPKPDRIASNEASALASLRTYLTAQNEFHRLDRYGEGLMLYANPKDGSGFGDLYELPDGTELKLIDRPFARSTSPDSPRVGYYFVDIAYEDYSLDCGLCAIPAEYGVTGKNTYIIDVTGVIYCEDNGGKPLTAFPDVKIY